MNNIPGGYPDEVSLTNCDREPIHIIGRSQPHGIIIACSKQNFTITQCSENTGKIAGIPWQELLGKPLSVLLPKNLYDSLDLRKEEKILLPDVSLNGSLFLVIAHISEDSLLLDFEPYGNKSQPMLFQQQLARILNHINAAGSIEDLGKKAVSQVKSQYAYDRVMLYKFDEDWNGEVVAEEKEEHLKSWLGLHYPATDIPKPSRDLFLKQGVRIIQDVNHVPALIRPQLSPINDKPLDLSRSELRGVSPIHLEYLRNMGVGASLTAAIVLNGKLWGLLACHHYSSKFLDYHQRQAINFLSQVFTNRLAVMATGVFLEETRRYNALRQRLVEQMQTSQDVQNALTREKVKLTDLIKSSGGALYLNGKLDLLGKTPSEKDTRNLITEFLLKKEGTFYTNNLIKIFPSAINYRAEASGVLSVRLGEMDEDLIIWFREEISGTVAWGGKPEKNKVEKGGITYLSPRKSFEKWTQIVSGKALLWKDYELEAATALKENVVYFLLQQQKDKIEKLNNQIIGVNQELEAFSYSVSHDLRAPLRGINGFATILQEEYAENLDDRGKRALKIILDSAAEMEELIEDLLTFAKLGVQVEEIKTVEPESLIKDILVFMNFEEQYPQTKFLVQEDMPVIKGDSRLLKQLFANLIDNAAKYSAKVEDPLVEIGCEYKKGKPAVFFIKDNGIGFDPRYTEKIFKVFSRLSGDEYEGTGIGLAIAHKVVKNHHGKLWVHSELKKGSTFYFTLEE